MTIRRGEAPLLPDRPGLREALVGRENRDAARAVRIRR
jgi:hypothetical protein